MKILILVFSLVTGFTYSQYDTYFTVNNVRLVGHTAYMIDVLQAVASELEHREWCNLKVPDITSIVNETVLDQGYFGTVVYSNGFVTSMQRIDIRQSGIDQVWAWNATEETGTVIVSGTLRMLDLALGYDVAAELQDGHHRYTVTITYPLILFTFHIRKNVNTEVVEVAVEGSISTTATVNRIKFLPADNTTDVLTTMFNIGLPEQGILAWGPDVFQAIALDVYDNKVEFPRICYDCPVTAT